MDFKILEVSDQACYLNVRVEHYHSDGSTWFTEDYGWQGREGLKQKRATNEQGKILRNNGVVAPVKGNPPKQYLPKGKAWKLMAPPIMDGDAILGVIKATHVQRLASGWPDSVNTLSTRTPSQEDRDGCGMLVSTFKHLEGFTV